MAQGKRQQLILYQQIICEASLLTITWQLLSTSCPPHRGMQSPPSLLRRTILRSSWQHHGTGRFTSMTSSKGRRTLERHMIIGRLFLTSALGPMTLKHSQQGWIGQSTSTQSKSERPWRFANIDTNRLDLESGALQTLSKHAAPVRCHVYNKPHSEYPWSRGYNAPQPADSE
jgi:hypothetical protein